MSNKRKTIKDGSDSDSGQSRRSFIGKAGMAAAAVLNQGQRQPAPPAAEAEKPLTTPVDQLLKLSRAQMGQLTPTARSLTKGDLLALGRGDVGGSPKLRNLKMEDLKSLTDVMAGLAGPAAQVRPRPGGPGITIGCCSVTIELGRSSPNCCCCCCCCCAVAMTPAKSIV